MQKVYSRISLEIVDNYNGFFRKLKEFVGEFTIEGQDFTDYPNSFKISFYTDKLAFKEGENRSVIILATEQNGDWNFTAIEK